jgi:hypothetical protein
MGGKVFVSERVLLGVSPDAARAWLGRLAADGVLLGAAEYAYGQGIDDLGGLAGPAAGMSRLAAVRAGEIAETPDGAGLGLRWEAIGPDGGLFPALDANLTLSPAGEATTVLTLTGVSRLPRQAADAVAPAIAHWFAAVTTRSFIARLACDLMQPAGVAPR